MREITKLYGMEDHDDWSCRSRAHSHTSVIPQSHDDVDVYALDDSNSVFTPSYLNQSERLSTLRGSGRFLLGGVRCFDWMGIRTGSSSGLAAWASCGHH